ncbi:MAG: hypothetical protein M8860_03085 [marine benthic group bacterium]|jgi:hypothetical protein|nr:hypothetical protein [Gemmatimonadota bacterium]MCL7961824.1 hypothetical protein [Candidatus Carthagonibacter metallireducens]MCL7957656.1 hypothetical protein [Gemmatimonadota bacterium]MCL7967211.1 hypothetical protein [Gemmatimonadota bacterium]MCL7974905.1 hypothetical protein [Gemmatimonadota bacterium]
MAKSNEWLIENLLRQSREAESTAKAYERRARQKRHEAVKARQGAHPA